MDIDKIIKECPKAWEGCMKYFIHPHNYDALEFKYIWNPNTNRIEIWEGDYLDLEIHPRELYDFFDSVGIVVATCLVDDDTFTCILYKIGEEDIFDYNKKTRTEAEYRAFEKAFEIYEKQLGEV